jgi:hypothetical protein
LDNKRFEMIQFIFKQASLYLTEVFKRLVFKGTGAFSDEKEGDNEVCFINFFSFKILLFLGF